MKASHLNRLKSLNRRKSQRENRKIKIMNRRYITKALILTVSAVLIIEHCMAASLRNEKSSDMSLSAEAMLLAQTVQEVEDPITCGQFTCVCSEVIPTCGSTDSATEEPSGDDVTRDLCDIAEIDDLLSEEQAACCTCCCEDGACDDADDDATTDDGTDDTGDTDNNGNGTTTTSGDDTNIGVQNYFINIQNPFAKMDDHMPPSVTVSKDHPEPQYHEPVYHESVYLDEPWTHEHHEEVYPDGFMPADKHLHIMPKQSAPQLFDFGQEDRSDWFSNYQKYRTPMVPYKPFPGLKQPTYAICEEIISVPSSVANGSDEFFTGFIEVAQMPWKPAQVRGQFV